jgi:hypothetical protein
MRLTLLLLATVVLVPSRSRADDAADARAMIEKAVKAAGLKPDGQPLARTWKDKGTFTAGGFEMKYTGNWAFQGPDRYRFAIEGEFGGMKIAITAIVNGNKAWESALGQSREITGEKLDYVKNQVYRLHVMSLVPLLSDKEFKLATAGLKEFDKTKTVGVTVTRGKHPPITLYFDSSTGLLARADSRVKDEFQEWKEVNEQVLLDGYKETGGKKFFTHMKIVRGGKTMLESELSEQKTPKTLDAKLFDKP